MHFAGTKSSIVIDWKHFSNTDLSDLRIVGTCDIFVTKCVTYSYIHVILPIG